MQFSGQALESSAAFVPSHSISSFPVPVKDAAVSSTRYVNPTASDWSVSHSKRLLDFTVALLALAVLTLPMLAIGLCVRLGSKGPALFVQSRAGRGGRSFRIYKFRSMTMAKPGCKGPAITCRGDHRITGIGRWLRKLKLDELPQFYNVLRGDMSLVGPRPRLPQHVVTVNMPYRPGLTGAATLAFRREEEMLSHLEASQLDSFYRQHVTPLKTRLDTRYMCRATFWTDLRLLAATFLVCIAPLRAPAAFRNLMAQRMDLEADPVD
jgi:lipopolysaccharide/colanic/teichoic acid biosynthesis glycosyltransferase